jgi:hypothetical protein
MNMEQIKTNLPNMSISAIAALIKNDWQKPNFAAKPYLNALSYLTSIKDNYGADEGRFIVAYFLSNAATWKGDVAREVKAELQKRLKTA